MRHGMKLLLADLTGELLLRIAVHYLVVLMKRPQLLEGFATRHALREKEERFGCNVELPSASLGWACSST